MIFYGWAEGDGQERGISRRAGMGLDIFGAISSLFSWSSLTLANSRCAAAAFPIAR